MLRFQLSPYALFPYERRLAGMEVAALSALHPRGHADAFSTGLFRSWPRAALRTTYFEYVTDNKRVVVPLQSQLEKGARGSKRRQSTRYSSHGLHEYKGKFNPQVVRVVGNIIGLRDGSRVLDPFCGSGTVLVEAIHNGWYADGVDANPLAVEIAQAKVDSLRMTDALAAGLGILRDDLGKIAGANDSSALTARHRRNLEARLSRGNDVREDEYLKSWFPRDVLLQVRVILNAIAGLHDDGCERVFRVILSDLLRSVSHQDEADLRVRRRKEPLINAPVIRRFVESAETKVSEVVTARALIGDQSNCGVRVEHGDSRRLSLNRSTPYDAIITSPPYAMALPYIDTQRLSLAALGLAPPKTLSRLEGTLIGNRDIPKGERLQLEAALSSGHHGLPEHAAQLCRSLLKALAVDDGFRRRNLPALLARYLIDMREFLVECRQLLRRGGHIAMVVGKNQTTIGGRVREIDTPRLLAEISASVGFHVLDVLTLETYQRYGLHAANSIREESLVLARA